MLSTQLKFCKIYLTTWFIQSQEGMPTKLPTTFVNSFECKQGAVRAVRFNADGCYCITCGRDNSLKLWNPYKNILVKTYMGVCDEILDAVGASDNSKILCGGADKQPTIFDVTTGNMIKRWKGHSGTVNAVAFNEDSTVAISASQDGTVRCHDVRFRGGPFQVFDEAMDGVLTVDVNSHEIATGSADNHLRVYDIRAGRLFVDCLGESVTDIHLTADDECILSSSMNSPIRLIEKSSGRLINDYTGHKNADFKIECDILSSNDKIVSGSEDGMVYIWDMVDSKVVAKLDHRCVSTDVKCVSPAKFIHSISAHPIEQILLTAARERVYLWQLPKDEEIIIE